MIFVNRIYTPERYGYINSCSHGSVVEYMYKYCIENMQVFKETKNVQKHHISDKKSLKIQPESAGISSEL
jgi:hypothetical protein